jgi:hypothetical protein
MNWPQKSAKIAKEKHHKRLSLRSLRSFVAEIRFFAVAGCSFISRGFKFFLVGFGRIYSDLVASG